MSIYNLKGLTIVSTRPKPEGKELQQLIIEAGGQGIWLATIDILSCIHEPRFTSQLAKIARCDWLIFVSPQAVTMSLPALAPYIAKQRLAAIGKGTAKRLAHDGFTDVLYPDQEMGSQGLLALAPLAQVAGQVIGIVRGEGGLDLLDQNLTARGATIESLIAYKRIMPTIADPYPWQLLAAQAIHAIIVTSADGLSNLQVLTPEALRPYLYPVPLIVVSERIKLLANELGFQRVWIAPNACHEAILTILSEKRDDLCQIKNNEKKLSP
jgi:uroporphyrinogen-III synthase